MVATTQPRLAMTAFNPITGQTVFRFRARKAGKVYLLGSFGEGQPSVVPMRKEQGQWTVKLRLPPGKFRYRFNADGILSKKAIAKVQLDYRYLADKLLLDVSASHTCLCHPHKWN